MQVLTETVSRLPIVLLQKSKARESIWKGSLFEWFNKIPSPRTKGAVGEKIVEQLMQRRGVDVIKPKNSNHDRIIGGYKVEIKTSGTWNNQKNKFTWQQLRNQDYERIIFVGINPNSISMWWATKSDLKKYVFGKNKYRQHAGKSGGQDLYWLQGIEKLPWFRKMKDF